MVHQINNKQNLFVITGRQICLTYSQSDFLGVINKWKNLIYMVIGKFMKNNPENRLNVGCRWVFGIFKTLIMMNIFVYLLDVEHSCPNVCHRVVCLNIFFSIILPRTVHARVPVRITCYCVLLFINIKIIELRRVCVTAHQQCSKVVNLKPIWSNQGLALLQSRLNSWINYSLNWELLSFPCNDLHEFIISFN